MTKHLSCLVLALGPMVAACDGSTLDAGKNQTEPGEYEYPTYHWAGEPSHSFEVPCTSPAPASVAGTWTGEFEEHAFLSGSRAMRVVIEGLSADDTLCGKVIFGEGEPPPIPSGPEADYAPGLPEEASFYKNSTVDRRKPVEGFAYEFGREPRQPPNEGAGDWTFPEVPDPKDEFHLFLGANQPYKAWCNQQTSYELQEEDIAGKFTCLPFRPYERSDDGCLYPAPGDSYAQIPISCTQATLCFDGSFCDCSTEGCTVPPRPELNGLNWTPYIYFDGDTVTGNVDLDNDGGISRPLAFRLTRGAE